MPVKGSSDDVTQPVNGDGSVKESRGGSKKEVETRGVENEMDGRDETRWNRQDGRVDIFPSHSPPDYPSDTDSTRRNSMVEKVRLMVCDGEPEVEGSKIKLTHHALFTQLDVLCHFQSGKMGWKEMSRWLKYEEKVDAGGRWSKPHVSTTSLHALMQLRNAVADNHCAIALTIRTESLNFVDVIEAIVSAISNHYSLSPALAKRIADVLQKPHKHKGRKGGPDINKTDEKEKGLLGRRHKRAPSMTASRRKSLVRREGKDLWAIYTAYPKGVLPENLLPYKANKKLKQKLPPGTEVANVLIGQLDNIDQQILAFCRLDPPVILNDTTEVDVPTRFLFLALGRAQTSSLWEYSEIGRAAAALFNDKVFCEVAYKAQSRQDLLAGMDEFMDELTVLPPSIWDPTTRLDPPLTTITVDKISDRLSEAGRRAARTESMHGQESADDDESLFRTGRLFGGLRCDFTKRVKHYKSDILDGLNMQCVASIIFLYFACITPIVTFGGLMEHKTNGYMGTIEMLLSGAICGIVFALFSGQPLTIVGATGPLLVFEAIIFEICHDNELNFLTVRFWIGAWIFLLLLLMVALDLSALVRFITRFTEESFAVLISVIFIYEAMTKLGSIWASHPVHVGVTREGANSSCFCVQPANQAFTNVTLAELNRMVDGRIVFAKPNSNTYAKIMKYYFKMSISLTETCATLGHRVLVRRDCITEDTCLEMNWSLEGDGCWLKSVTQSVPDVFLLSCVLLFGTFAVAIFFRNLRTTRYFPMQVRQTLGDFAVFLAVVLWTGVDALFGLQTSKLNVPAEFQTTRSDRGWVVNPADCIWWLIPLAGIPGILATILLFLDQQITAVIVNRKEHMLVKGHGYHLDLLVLAVLVFICSLLGLPWFCAATVRSISHVRSLVRESEVKAPGERPQMLGIREQRVTGIFIHVLIGLSSLFAVVLQHIPMPVLYGVFLYMGVTSLGGVQFIERVLIMFMPIKYQPDYIYLRHVQTSRVHAFTLIQILCSALMWIVKSIKETSIGFPIMLLALVTVRKGMDYIFTQRDLFWLDHLLPDHHRRKREDLARAIEEGAANARKFKYGQDDIDSGGADSGTEHNEVICTSGQIGGGDGQTVKRRAI